MATLGSVNRTKKGGVIFKANKEITLQPGECLFLHKPEENLNSLVSKGFITDVEAEERLAKIPDFVLFEATGIGKNKVV